MVRHRIKDRTEENREFEALREELGAIFVKRDQIKDRLREVYQTAQLTPEEISSYLRNPDHFTQNQWSQIERYRNEILQFLWTALGPEKKASWESAELKKLQKKKRQKGAASRRRGWLKMD